MSVQTHTLRVVAARRITHPVITEIEKHYFLVKASEMPTGIGTKANARDPVSMNRHVYRDVRKSLLGEDSTVGTFDLMNKGIVCLANSVRRIDDTTYEIEIDDSQGIVDGGHTYQIICSAQKGPAIPDEQHVEFQVRTGVRRDLVADISRGLNTGIQVAQHSLANLDGKFDWLKKLVANETWASNIAWNETDEGDLDVRDLICVLEALNVIDFPNDRPRHPISAYEKWSIPTGNFVKDAIEQKNDISKSTYYRLSPILIDAVKFSDHIRREFRDRYNDLFPNGKAAKLDIVEDAGKDKTFQFLYSNAPQSRWRLTKGAFFPIFAAFRNAIEIDPITGFARWIGGFSSAVSLWDNVAPELITMTKQATKDLGHKPDVIGKNRGHWTAMHQTVELHILRAERRAGLITSSN
jgi:AIPR protein